ncbi:MAG TPA: glycoside hydrolase family 2 TIM barrel-domain containing protein [Pseudomonadales bacterium]|jgi:hypothetical protein
MTSILGRFPAVLVLLSLADAGLVPEAGAMPDEPVKVEVVRTARGYALERGGRPYRIQGVGGLERLALLAESGGNSIRTWSVGTPEQSARELLDEAHRLGLTVALCLDIARERHGFDYDDDAAVAAQFERARADVLAHRNHPALLAWIIGNELNHDFKNPRVYDAVNEISRMIHEIDGNHPTTTTIAGFSADMAEVISARAPDIDFLSIQSYAGVLDLQRRVRKAGYEGPYVLTEWGPPGHWEVATTSWGAPIEPDSSAKAKALRRAHATAIEPYPDQLIGNYVFLWGQKQERTPTWYGLFTETGERTESVDVMQHLWTGAWPSNRSPAVRSVRLDGRRAGRDIVLVPGQTYPILARVRDPEGDALRYRWSVKSESRARQVGGDLEGAIADVDGLIDEPSSSRAQLTAPEEPGAYRVFVYAYDGNGGAAHANVPFLVRSPAGAD